MPADQRYDIQAALDAGRGNSVDAQLAQLKSTLAPATEAPAPKGAGS